MRADQSVSTKCVPRCCQSARERERRGWGTERGTFLDTFLCFQLCGGIFPSILMENDHPLLLGFAAYKPLGDEIENRKTRPAGCTGPCIVAEAQSCRLSSPFPEVFFHLLRLVRRLAAIANLVLCIWTDKNIKYTWHVLSSLAVSCPDDKAGV